MNEDVNEAIWPRRELIQEFPCALDFILVEIAEEDLATDVAGWPNGLHFPRGDDPEVEWSVQRGRLKEEFSAHAEALSTKMEWLTLKADIDDAIVTWRLICDQGLPQASLGPTLRKLEAEKLFTMLAKHCRSNNRWHTVSGTTIFDERLGRGRSVAEQGHVLANSSESDFQQVENSEWSPPWYYPNDAFSALTRKCAEREMSLEIYHHEHAHHQWTSTIVVQKTELDPDCEMESDLLSISDVSESISDVSEHSHVEEQRFVTKSVAWRGTVSADSFGSSNATAYLVLGTLFPEETPGTWTQDKYFLRLQADFQWFQTVHGQRFRAVCSTCADFYKTGVMRSVDEIKSLRRGQTCNYHYHPERAAEEGLGECPRCKLWVSRETFGEMCIECGRFFTEPS